MIKTNLSLVATLALFNVDLTNLDTEQGNSRDITPDQSVYTAYDIDDGTFYQSADMADLKGPSRVLIAWSFNVVDGKIFAVLTDIKGKKLSELDLANIGRYIDVNGAYYQTRQFANAAMAEIIEGNDWDGFVFQRVDGKFVAAKTGKVMLMPSIRGMVQIAIVDGKSTKLAVTDLFTINRYLSGEIGLKSLTTQLETAGDIIDAPTTDFVVLCRVFPTKDSALAITNGKQTWVYGILEGKLMLNETASGKVHGIPLQAIDEFGVPKDNVVAMITRDDQGKVKVIKNLNATDAIAQQPGLTGFTDRRAQRAS